MIKVFIPTYKRLNSLKWVLYSLIKTKSPLNNLEKVCFIVNNYPTNANNVSKIIKNLEGMDVNGWKFTIINRETTLPPIDSWYNAIKEYSNYGDIVFLNGDDDLFLFDSISGRVNAILNEGADLLLTKHIGGLTFLNDASSLIPPNEFKIHSNNYNCSKITLSDEKWSAIFMSNNTYYYSNKLEDALSKCYKWCDEQKWLPHELRTLMFPFYIPIALIIENGTVIFQDNIYVVRGSNLEERIKSKWSVPGWNSGFIQLLVNGILNNSELNHIKELVYDRKVCNDFSAQWYYTFFLDSRITREMREKTFLQIGKPDMNFKMHLQALKFILKDYIIRRTRLSKLKYVFLKKRKIDTKEYIDSFEEF